MTRKEMRQTDARLQALFTRRNNAEAAGKWQQTAAINKAIQARYAELEAVSP